MAPLRRLLVVAAVAVGRADACQSALASSAELSHGRQHVRRAGCCLSLLRWSFGLLGVLGLLWMAWQTLKIPNTQSATGILYVAVIGVFVGELTGLLLSAESAFPL